MAIVPARKEAKYISPVNHSAETIRHHHHHHHYHRVLDISVLNSEV